MRTTLFRISLATIGAALALGAAPALAQPQASAAPVYGPQLDPRPVMFDPQGEPRDLPQQGADLFGKFFRKLTPYEQAVSDWKGRQYQCMKRGTLCFEARPLPSDQLAMPRGR